jgi:hypothetical protein
MDRYPQKIVMFLSMTCLVACQPLKMIFDPNSNHSTVYGAQPMTALEDDAPADLARIIDPEIGPIEAYRPASSLNNSLSNFGVGLAALVSRA